jgi:hypothetical protein
VNDKESRFKITKTRQTPEPSEPPSPGDPNQSVVGALVRRVEYLEKENAKLMQIVADLQRRIGAIESHQ